MTMIRRLECMENGQPGLQTVTAELKMNERKSSGIRKKMCTKIHDI